MMINDVPGRTIQTTFNHHTKLGSVTVSFSDLRRSSLHNVLDALDGAIADFSRGETEGTVFASTLIVGGPRQPSWQYLITSTPQKVSQP